MSKRWAKVFQRCGLIMDPATGCITQSKGQEVVILLAGGNKQTQSKDIKTALRLARNL